MLHAIEVLQRLFDGDPEIEKSSEVHEEWGVRDVGVLGAPGFYAKASREKAESECRNTGDETDPHFYRVMVKRATIQIDGVMFSSPWRFHPTEEQLRLMPGWRDSVGKDAQ